MRCALSEGIYDNLMQRPLLLPRVQWAVASRASPHDARLPHQSASIPNTSCVDVESHIFWIFATLDVVISIVLVVRVRTAAAGTVKAEHLALARGQQKGSWLACAIVWIVLLSDGCPVRNYLYVAGALVIAWLLHRTVQRFRRLQSV